MNESVSVPKTQTIEMGGKQVVIKKMAMRKAINFFNSIGSLPNELANIPGQSGEQILRQLPMIIAKLLPTLAAGLAEAISDKDQKITKEFLLDECGFDEILHFVTVFLEVNNAPFIIEELKKIRAVVSNQDKPNLNPTPNG